LVVRVLELGLAVAHGTRAEMSLAIQTQLTAAREAVVHGQLSLLLVYRNMNRKLGSIRRSMRG